MTDTNTKVAKRLLQDKLHPSTIGMTKGNIRLRWGFFYTGGKTSEKYVDAVTKILKDTGLNCVVIDHGQVWRDFRGGASVAASSHFYVIVQIQD